MAITFDRISYRYRRSRPMVIDRLSWEVPAGRTVLLGPNGAGKTTLLGIGADVLRPQHGTVRLGHLDLARRRDRQAYRAAVGWMPQHIRAIPGLTCREQIAYAGWLKGMSRAAAWEAALDALRRVDLSDRRETLASQVSGGQLRRVGLGQTLVHAARVLLLDEPTVGLDPAQRRRFREILSGLPQETAVVVSTHQVDDLSDLFATVVVIDEGRILWQGPTEGFLSLAPAGAYRPGEVAYATLLGGRH